MDTSYKFSYPCKTISNFYDNFYCIHIYDEIKQVVYRKVLETKHQELFMYFKLFQLIFSLPLDSDFDKYKENYYLAVGDKFLNKYDDIIKVSSKNIYEAIYKFTKMKSSDLKETFVVYLYLQNIISKNVGYNILLPANLIIECNAILDEEIGKYFLQSWFNMLFKPKKYELKEIIVKKYKKCKCIFSKLPIDEIYLFGSIYKDEYYDSSDIDLVVKFKTPITPDRIIQIKEIISAYNKKNFQRNTDIQNYYDYIQLHDINDSLKLY